MDEYRQVFLQVGSCNLLEDPSLRHFESIRQQEHGIPFCSCDHKTQCHACTYHKFLIVVRDTSTNHIQVYINTYRSIIPKSCLRTSCARFMLRA
jgi:hypothetical protein